MKPKIYEVMCASFGWSGRTGIYNKLDGRVERSFDPGAVAVVVLVPVVECILIMFDVLHLFPAIK